MGYLRGSTGSWNTRSIKTYMIMENINLNELRNIAYKTACDHGLHDKELLRK